MCYLSFTESTKSGRGVLLSLAFLRPQVQRVAECDILWQTIVAFLLAIGRFCASSYGFAKSKVELLINFPFHSS